MGTLGPVDMAIRFTVTGRCVAACLTVVLAAAGAACSADRPAPDGARPRPSAGSPAAAVPRHPLTGLPAPTGVPDRPVLAVKIDNTAGAAPQRGLAAADLVVEELVEGGLTRLTGLYHSRLPPAVGPVRSIRTTDVGLVAPVDGALVASGGAGPALAAARQAGVDSALAGAAGMYRSDTRPSPYDVLLHPHKLATTLPEQNPPQPLVPQAAGADLDGTPTRTLRAEFSPAHTTRWRFHPGRGDHQRGWIRAHSPAPPGRAFVADTVLVLEVTTRSAGYRDPAGNPVPETVLTGTGRAWTLAGPQLVTARWSKQGPHAPFQLTDDRGRPLQLPPGRTWIELVPTAGSIHAK